VRQSEINAAVRAKIEGLAGLPPRLYENELKLTDGSRKPTGTHIRVFILPVGSQDDSLGCDRWIGLIQCSVLVRDGVGTSQAIDIADAIIDSMPKGEELTSGGSTILIENNGYVGDAITADGWHIQNVTITYRGTK